MESLKPILLLVVLSVVGYGVYVALNQAPPAEPAPRSAPNWNKSGPPAAVPGKRAAATSMPPATTPPVASASAPAAASSPLSSGSSLPFGIGSSSLKSAASALAPQSAADAPSTPTSQPPEATAAAPPQRSTLAPPDNQSADAERSRREFAASMRAAQTMLASNNLVDALRELSRWYDHPALTASDQSQLVDLLGQLAGSVIYSRDHWLGPPYVVQQGETLENIATQCQVPWQLLAKINGIENPNQLTPGDQLKVIRGPFYAQLNLQQQSLALFVDGMYAGRFPVQGGRESLKPEGTYPVTKFAVDQSNPSQRPYISLGGDLHLRVPDDAVSPGASAVRINPRDMSDVFDMLSERSQVTVRR